MDMVGKIVPLPWS